MARQRQVQFSSGINQALLAAWDRKLTNSVAVKQSNGEPYLEVLPDGRRQWVFDSDPLARQAAMMGWPDCSKWKLTYGIKP